jgi:hypothetical protein
MARRSLPMCGDTRPTQLCSACRLRVAVESGATVQLAIGSREVWWGLVGVSYTSDSGPAPQAYGARLAVGVRYANDAPYPLIGR